VDPNFFSPVHLAQDTLDDGDISQLIQWLGGKPRLTKGPRTIEFEASFAELVGARFGVFVNSGSSANLLVASAMMQLGGLRNNRVVCPAVSWVTTVTPFIQLGFDVALVEADSEDLGVDIEALERLFIDFDPAVLVIVHVLGHPNKMAQILELCRRYDVRLVEDACEALGTTTLGGDWLGTLGECGTFSFYFGHHISTIEGGMVVTDDEELYELMLSIRSHGWSRDLSIDTQERLRGEWQVDDFSNFYTFYFEGFNLRPTDLSAQLGMTQLPKINQIAEARQNNFNLYRNALHNYWTQSSLTGRLSSFAFGTLVENREGLARALSQSGIESRPLICGNIGRHPFWLRKHSEFRSPMADLVHEKGIYFPNHTRLDPSMIEAVCEIVMRESVPVYPENMVR
jgi:CDP-6-deoxy-D-xylo-4-hexulose-3-dehydrase